MLKKIGKKQLLGILTAAAIVVTTVGTFAVWDTIEGTSTGTVTLAEPIMVTAENMTFTEAKTMGDLPTYSGEAVFKVANVEDLSKVRLALEATISDGETPVSNTDVTVSITQSGDATFNGSLDTDLAETNTYTVTVKPNDTDAAKALAGKSLSIAIKGTLASKPAA